jgi:hypothetical protein
LIVEPREEVGCPMTSRTRNERGIISLWERSSEESHVI